MHKLSILLFLLLLVNVSNAQQRPDAPPYAQLGEYAVGMTEFTIEDDDRPLRVTLWYPAAPAPPADAPLAVYDLAVIQFESSALADVPAADGTFPLVVFSHGSGGFRFQSLWLTEHLASWGFVVISADHPTNTFADQINVPRFTENLASNYVLRPRDVIRQIDFAQTLTDTGEFAGLIDIEQIAVIGHSFGGYTALATAGATLDFQQLQTYCETATFELASSVCFLTEEEDKITPLVGGEPPYIVGSDPRVDAVVALAPWNGPILNQASLAQIDIPTLIIVGTGDRVTIPERDAYTIFDQMVNAPRTLTTFVNGDHFIFVDPCFEEATALGFFDLCSDPVWDLKRVHDISNHQITAFLLEALKGINAPTPETFVGVETTTAEPEAIQRLVPQIITRYPHDTSAFTQGLLLYEGELYESTGNYGVSTLRRVAVNSGEVLQAHSLDSVYFAEGLALVDDRLLQLTWRERTLFIYDRESFEVLERLSYEGEGWGLCYDGTALYHSDGSSSIDRRDPQTFDVIETITITQEGQPVTLLNELECVGDQIYANVWQSDNIVRFDKQSGIVNAVIDASGLLTPEEAAGPADVLNGIAYDATNDEFLITGKWWPWLYRVTFIPAG